MDTKTFDLFRIFFSSSFFEQKKDKKENWMDVKTCSCIFSLRGFRTNCNENLKKKTKCYSVIETIIWREIDIKTKFMWIMMLLSINTWIFIKWVSFLWAHWILNKENQQQKDKHREHAYSFDSKQLYTKRKGLMIEKWFSSFVVLLCASVIYYINIGLKKFVITIITTNTWINLF